MNILIVEDESSIANRIQRLTEEILNDQITSITINGLRK